MVVCDTAMVNTLPYNAATTVHASFRCGRFVASPNVAVNWTICSPASATSAAPYVQSNTVQRAHDVQLPGDVPTAPRR